MVHIRAIWHPEIDDQGANPYAKSDEKNLETDAPMNLNTRIRPELWNAIQSSFESGNYANSVKDAMSLLTEVLRDKSGEDGDGWELVSKALKGQKGTPPKIQITRLQTQSEKNIQDGFFHLLAGMYQMIRNPRVHDRNQDDSRQEAEAIIIFIDYLLNILAKAVEAFTVDRFVSFVHDDYFVKNYSYAQRLVDEIPKTKRYDVLIGLHRRAVWNHSDNQKLVFERLFDKLTRKEVEDFSIIISRELRSIDYDGGLSLILKLYGEHIWEFIEPIAKTRIEHMLINHIANAEFNSLTNRASDAVSTWTTRILPHMELLSVLGDTLSGKLYSEESEQEYVAHFFLSSFPSIFSSERQIAACFSAIMYSIEMGNEFLIKSVENTSRNWPSEWQQLLTEKLTERNLLDTEKSSKNKLKIIRLQDDDPFDGSGAHEEDNIPF